MRKGKLLPLCLLLAALPLCTASCGGPQAPPADAPSVISQEVQLELPDGPGQASKPTTEQVEVAPEEYDAYLKKYVVPYGNLKFYDQNWTDAKDLGADRVFEFALQCNFNYYLSGFDYTEVWGDEFTRRQVPEAWFDETYGCVYPQDILENVAMEYFGLDAEYLRVSKSYLPSKNGYAVMEEQIPPSELLPVVTQVQRDGIRAQITFDLLPADASGKATGEAIAACVMTVEDKTETFRYVSVERHPV